MKLENPKRAIAIYPLIALVGAVAILLFASATSDASSGGWSSAVQLTSSANASDVAIDPTTGKAEVAWVDGSSTNKSYWYSECDPTKTTNVCTPPTNLYTGLAPIPAGPVTPGGDQIDPQFNTSDALRPSIAVDNSGNVYVGFPNPPAGPGSGGKAYFRRKPAGGSFGPGVLLGNGWSVRLATDPSGNLHAVWGASAIVSYKKFAPGSTTPSITKSSFASGANGAIVATDSAGNAHIVWEDNSSPKAIQYKEIDKNGNVGTTKQVYQAGANSINPNISVDSSNRLNIAWRTVAGGVGNILYQSFDNSGNLGSPNPASPKKLSGGLDSNEAWVATVGSDYFVTWQEGGGSSLAVSVFFGPTSDRNVVDGNGRESWPSIAGNQTNGELSLAYMYAPGDGSQNLIYRHRNCNCNSGPTSTPTSTGTATKTPTQTNTPTATNTPGGPTPTPTNTIPAPPHGTPVNLSNSGLTDKLPSIVINGSNDIVVAWEKDNSSSSKDIYARVAPGGGAFNGAFNITSNAPSSLQPNLFNSDADVYSVFQDSSDIGYSILHGGSWSAVTTINAPGQSAQNVVGVQASDGKNWVAWRAVNPFSYNTWALQIGGGQYQLSNSTSAASPSITAGASGHVFVAWLDKGPAANQSNIMVSEWNGSSWNTLPNPGTGTQPSVAFANGSLYVVWVNGAKIKQSIWNGSTWSAATNAGSGTAPKTPKIFIPASGNVFVVWSDSGKIYLSINGGAKQAVSGTVTQSKNPAIYVDNNDVPYIVWNNTEIWYVANP